MFLSTVDNQYLVGASSPSGHSISSLRPLGGAPHRCRAYLDAGKARAQNFVRAFAPCDRPPSMFRQRQGQTLGGKPVSSMIHTLIGPWRSISGSTISSDLANTAWSDQGELATKCSIF